MNPYASSLAMALAAVVVQALAGSPRGITEPGYPANTQGDSSDVVWWNSTGREVRDMVRGRRWQAQYYYKQWDTATGKWRDLPIPDDISLLQTVATSEGLFSVGTKPSSPTVPAPPHTIIWLPKGGGAFSGQLSLARHPGMVVPLADQSVLLVGGRMDSDNVRTNAVERVRRVGNGLEVERLPDIPGPLRHSYAVVALADGRAMILGGTTSNYIGCSGCLGETFILDPENKSWSPGPKLLEPRADATATRLPDGSVLVAGGWTPGHDWDEESSRSTERWYPGDPTFSGGPPLPIVTAGHQVKWLAGSSGKVLLLAGGFVRAWEGNDVVAAFDVARNEWRTVAERCQADHTTGELSSFGSLIHQGAPFVWCSHEALTRGEYLHLRLPSIAASIVQTDEVQGYALRRGSAAVATGLGDGRLLLAGGYMEASETLSTSTDLFDANGRLVSLAALNHMRHDARAFTLPTGGFLVVGGSASSWRDRANTARPELPYEWLPGGPDMASTHWRDIKPWFHTESVFGQHADGSLIVVVGDGTAVEQATFAMAGDNTLTVRKTMLPNLNRWRSTGKSGDGGHPIIVRGLPDGRIVVAGGSMHARNVAVLAEDSLEGDAADWYVELGERIPARLHEIYDPKTNQWRVSAAAEGSGGPVAILDTGQVVMLTPGKTSGEQSADGSWPRSEGILEISAGDGESWQRVSPLPEIMLNEHARPFVIQGELMMTGVGKTGARDGPTMLQWFDSVEKRWVTLWEAPMQTNSREHIGRVIVRQLHGKQLAIPVGGL